MVVAVVVVGDGSDEGVFVFFLYGDGFFEPLFGLFELSVFGVGGC